MKIRVYPEGIIRALHNDRLNLATIGKFWVARASWVEPDAQGRWWVDLENSRGPILGPFSTRAEALKAEVVWLERHRL